MVPQKVNLANRVVNQLCEHKLVKAVTFVGTSRVAEILSHKCRMLNKRIIALGGAKNHLVASPDCELEMVFSISHKTSSDIVASFTGCAGQRCMAASVLLTIETQKELIDLIVKKAGVITKGQKGPLKMGPVIDQPSLERIHSYIEDASKTAEILLDGRGWSQSEGYWIGPTIILHKDLSDAALHHEIFGPVLSIFVCQSAQQALKIENANPYGNAACIYTTQGNVAEYFKKGFSAGMIGVNIGVPVPREPFSFGGINNSKYGDFDITGSGGLDFFTTKIKVTQKWAKPAEQSWLS
jgi:malonate-semialdehyde dehydrogenase (acetylating)/methylmalonate-semialdehyde dehydrogenase